MYSIEKKIKYARETFYWISGEYFFPPFIPAANTVDPSPLWRKKSEANIQDIQTD
jgi:hypothetical protein